MNKEEYLREALAKYGITNMNELDEALRKECRIDISVFCSPVKEESK